MSEKCVIGFVPVNVRSSAAFPEPVVLKTQRERPLGRRAVQACPAVNEFERRTIEVKAPFSIGLRCERNRKGGFDFHLLEEYTRLDHDLIETFVSFMPREIWRSNDAPVVQISLPHVFVCDEECHLTQMPPWASANGVTYPGQFIGGRFPTHLWPRSLNLSFEWSDLSQDFRMSRGQPACYLFVEAPHASSPPKLVPSERTPELAEYLSRIEDVVKFTSGSFSLIDKVKVYRPDQLVVPCAR